MHEYNNYYSGLQLLLKSKGNKGNAALWLVIDYAF